MDYQFKDEVGREHHVEQALEIKEVDMFNPTAHTLIMEADGTHYALTVIPLDKTHNRHVGDATAPQILVIGGVGRSAYCFKVKGYLSADYFAEKMRCSTTDAYNMIHMLNEAGYRLPREAPLEIVETPK